MSKVRSARGTMVDFGVLRIKQQIAEQSTNKKQSQKPFIVEDEKGNQTIKMNNNK